MTDVAHDDTTFLGFNGVGHRQPGRLRRLARRHRGGGARDRAGRPRRPDRSTRRADGPAGHPAARRRAAPTWPGRSSCSTSTQPELRGRPLVLLRRRRQRRRSSASFDAPQHRAGLRPGRQRQEAARTWSGAARRRADGRRVRDEDRPPGDLRHGGRDRRCRRAGARRRSIPSATPAINDAHGFAEITLNMMRDWMGHDSIDDNGFVIMSRVHYDMRVRERLLGRRAQMTYGDGGRQVLPAERRGRRGGARDQPRLHRASTPTSPTPAMSGGLNESFSDIAGTIAEFYIDGRRRPTSWSARTSSSQDGALRYMCDPPADGLYRSIRARRLRRRLERPSAASTSTTRAACPTRPSACRSAASRPPRTGDSIESDASARSAPPGTWPTPPTGPRAPPTPRAARDGRRGARARLLVRGGRGAERVVGRRRRRAATAAGCVCDERRPLRAGAARPAPAAPATAAPAREDCGWLEEGQVQDRHRRLQPVRRAGRLRRRRLRRGRDRRELRPGLRLRRARRQLRLGGALRLLVRRRSATTTDDCCADVEDVCRVAAGPQPPSSSRARSPRAGSAASAAAICSASFFDLPTARAHSSAPIVTATTNRLS